MAAVSFSPAGGEVLVHLSHDGRFAHLIVSDRGLKVLEGRIERIFERYYSERRDDLAGEAPGSYFGIGLGIARNVEAMGGTIVAEPAHGTGHRGSRRSPAARAQPRLMRASTDAPSLMEARLKTGLWIKALVRRCDLAAVGVAAGPAATMIGAPSLLKSAPATKAARCWSRHAGRTASWYGCARPD